jgi:hypothetical protein
MNKRVGNRDKRIALLLAAAFAWLFIGSLIIFHEEHVLGKHFNLTSQLFISPKSKDKQGFTVKLLQPVQKFQDNVGITGILTIAGTSAIQRVASDFKFKEISSSYHEDIILGNLSLRAPPSV